MSERDQKQNTAQYDAFLLQLHKFGSEVFFLGGREGGGAGRGGAGNLAGLRDLLGLHLTLQSTVSDSQVPWVCTCQNLVKAAPT